jgi:hypothetical protein
MWNGRTLTVANLDVDLPLHASILALATGSSRVWPPPALIPENSSGHGRSSAQTGDVCARAASLGTLSLVARRARISATVGVPFLDLVDAG